MQKWMVVKLGSIFLLFLYQFKTHQIFKQLQLDIYKYSSFQMRVWNEITTLFLYFIFENKELSAISWGIDKGEPV